jgi:hypothetical protein
METKPYARPCGIAIGLDARVFMLDCNAAALRIIRPDGQTSGAIRIPDLSTVGQADLAMAADGSIYLVPGAGKGIRHLLASGEEIKENYVEGVRMWTDGNLSRGSTLAPDGFFYDFVQEGDRFGLQKRDRLGNVLGSPVFTGGIGSGPGDFSQCHGGRMGNIPMGCIPNMSVSEEGKIFILDYGNKRIQRFSQEGGFEAAFVPRNEESELLPRRVSIIELRATKSNGFLLNSRYDSMVYRFSRDGAWQQTWGDPIDWPGIEPGITSFVSLPDESVMTLNKGPDGSTGWWISPMRPNLATEDLINREGAHSSPEGRDGTRE